MMTESGTPRSHNIIGIRSSCYVKPRIAAPAPFGQAETGLMEVMLYAKSCAMKETRKYQ